MEEMLKIISMRDASSVPDLPPPPEPEYTEPEPVAAVQEQIEEEEEIDEIEFEETQPTGAPETPAMPKTKIYEGHVRSGQQVR